MSTRLPPVLVVDDEKNMRLSLKTVLADEKYSVRAVESAEEAMGLLEREEFFMVITDARLGGMSGYEFLGKARAKWPDVPVLMITAYATPKLAVEAIHAGAMDYLPKPFAPEELLHAVARCADASSFASTCSTMAGRSTRSRIASWISISIARMSSELGLQPRTSVTEAASTRGLSHYLVSPAGVQCLSSIPIPK